MGIAEFVGIDGIRVGSGKAALCRRALLADTKSARSHLHIQPNTVSLSYMAPICDSPRMFPALRTPGQLLPAEGRGGNLRLWEKSQAGSHKIRSPVEISYAKSDVYWNRGRRKVTKFGWPVRITLTAPSSLPRGPHGAIGCTRFPHFGKALR